MLNSVRKSRLGGLSILALAVALAGCAVGPDFVPPAAPDVNRYTKEPLAQHTSSSDAPNGQSQHFSSGRDIPQEWWTLFKSPRLNALMAQALKNNPNLQSAIATLRANKEAVYAQQGKFFPQVQYNFNPQRAQTAAVLAPIPANNANIYNLYTNQVIVGYTFDVWGLNRRTVESLQALTDTQRFEVEAAYLTLTSSIAVAAINEASLRAQIDATNQMISINEKMLDILKRQFNTGYASRNDVALQEAALAQVLATLPPLRKALQQNRDQISALAGVYTSDEPHETFKLDDLKLPADLPVSLPSQLIEQRPDIRASQEQLHSASAQVGVAVANMLPSFTISANAGYMNTVLTGLLSPANAFWTLAGNATQTVFDGGTLLHTLRGAQATYDAAAWSYKSTVVSAVQNVTDSLRAIENDADALKAAHDYERAAKISFDLAQQQMQTGYANILILLTAQQTYLQSVIQVVQARAARLSDTAALFQALGGGWWNRTDPPVEKILDVGTDQSATLVDRNYGANPVKAIFDAARHTTASEQAPPAPTAPAPAPVGQTETSK
jgi:NodT family efflux transporter outer membrane factor (OMF) lipoprotein